MSDFNNYKLVSLKEIFENRVFRIPSYQRGYSWEEKERKDLIKDIENVIGESHMHFTGTLVVTPSNNYESSLDVVDGQQRLTSLLLLLAVIYHSYQEEESERPGLLEEVKEQFLLSGEYTGNSIRKFQLQPSYDLIFDHIIRYIPYKHPPKNKAEENIISAYQEFFEWVLKNMENRLIIVETIINQLGFLFYIPTNTNEIGIMFEVINNRGKKLSELEKVKNYLIYFADKHKIGDLKNRVETKWGALLANLHAVGFHSNNAENSFLRNCWVVFKETRKSESWNIYDSLKIYYPIEDRSNWQELVEFTIFLEDASNTYKKLFSRVGVTIFSEKHQLERIANHTTHASILPVLLAIYSKIHSSKKRLEVIELLEKLNFRCYVLKILKRGDTGQGWLFDIAHKLYNDANFTEDNLKESLKNFVNHHAPNNLFKDCLTIQSDDERKNLYPKDWLKFFLANYEEFLRSKKGESIDFSKMLATKNKQAPNDFFHKEHIWATKEFSVINDKGKPCLDKRRLGNFILLKETQNIKVSNKRLEQKIDLYWADRDNDPNTLMIRELRRLFVSAQKKIDSHRSNRTKKYWQEVYRTFLEAREKKLLKFALERWGI